MITWGLHWWLSSKESACNAGATGGVGLIPGSGKIPWRRKWQPTPVVLPGESHGQRSLAGCSLQGPTELDSTEATQHERTHGYMFSLVRNCHGCTFNFLPAMSRSSYGFIPLSACGVVDFDHSDRCSVAFHCCFNLHFSNGMILGIFSYPYWLYLCFVLVRCLFRSFAYS